jgi:Asp/Glu/hydantoin racemase
VTAGNGLRLWLQGLVPLTDQSRPYFEARAAHARAVCGDQTQVEFHSARPDFFPPGVSPADLAATQAGEHLYELLVVDAAITAEADGYAAFAIGVIQDSGLRLARTLADIPVVGYGQAVALLGQCWGSRLGVLAFNPALFPLIASRLKAHVPGLVVGIEDVDLSYDEILRSFTQPKAADLLRKRLSAAAVPLLRAGADVLVPGQLVLSEATSHVGLRQVQGATVLDGLAVTITLAESMAVLRQRAGIDASRISAGWRRPEDPVREMIARCAKAAMAGASGTGPE